MIDFMVLCKMALIVALDAIAKSKKAIKIKEI